MDAFDGVKSKVSVTLRTADGTIVGTQELDQSGGDFRKSSGCEWTVSFDQVDPSDFYEAEVTSNRDLDEKSQTQTQDGKAEITIAF